MPSLGQHSIVDYLRAFFFLQITNFVNFAECGVIRKNHFLE